MATTDTPYEWPQPLASQGYPPFSPTEPFERVVSYWEIPKATLHELMWRVKSFKWEYDYEYQFQDEDFPVEIRYGISGSAKVAVDEYGDFPLSDETQLLATEDYPSRLGWWGYETPEHPPFPESGAGVRIGGYLTFPWLSTEQGPIFYDSTNDTYHLTAVWQIGLDPALPFDSDHPFTDPANLNWGAKLLIDDPPIYFRREMIVYPEEWWPYDPGDTDGYPGKVGSGPIYHKNTGAILRNPLAIARRPDGTFYNPLHRP